MAASLPGIVVKGHGTGLDGQITGMAGVDFFRGHQGSETHSFLHDYGCNEVIPDSIVEKGGDVHQSTLVMCPPQQITHTHSHTQRKSGCEQHIFGQDPTIERMGS